MATCRSYGCDREVPEPYWHCCHLCFEAHHDHYPVDEHTPECNLRHAAIGDSVVRQWVAIYEQLSKRGPAYEETWRHLRRSFYGTDIGVLDRSEWDVICSQLRSVRDQDIKYLDIIGCPGLVIDLETGRTNYVDDDFKIEFPEEQ